MYDLQNHFYLYLIYLRYMHGEDWEMETGNCGAEMRGHHGEKTNKQKNPNVSLFFPMPGNPA